MSKLNEKTGFENTPEWELLGMKKALESMGGFFNDADDDDRLRLVRLELAVRRRARD